MKDMTTHKKILRSLKHTTRLGLFENKEATEVDAGHFPCNKKERRILQNINSILKQCHPDVLQAFHISPNKMFVDALSVVGLVCEMFVQLKILHVTHCHLSPTSFRSIMALHQLSDLNVFGTNTDDETLLLITENLLEIEHLDIGCTRISDDGLYHLQKLSKLEQLCLKGCHITNRGVAMISSLKNITDLDLSDGLDISDAGVVSLVSLQNLSKLNISWTMVKDVAIAQLYRMKKLAHLEVVGTALTDKSVRYLFNISRLRYLDIRETNITDVSVEHLLRTKNPDAVCLSGNKCC